MDKIVVQHGGQHHDVLEKPSFPLSKPRFLSPPSRPAGAFPPLKAKKYRKRNLKVSASYATGLPSSTSKSGMLKVMEVYKNQ